MDSRHQRLVSALTKKIEVGVTSTFPNQ